MIHYTQFFHILESRMEQILFANVHMNFNYNVTNVSKNAYISTPFLLHSIHTLYNNILYSLSQSQTLSTLTKLIDTARYISVSKRVWHKF